MGYSHYWRHPDLTSHSDLTRALADMRRCVDESGVAVEYRGAPWYGPNDLGFDAVEDSCETFAFLATDQSPDGFNSCKTRGLPYDVLVVACLAVAAELLGVRVLSDGDWRDWELGVALASRVLGRPVPNPIPAEE